MTGTALPRPRCRVLLAGVGGQGVLTAAKLLGFAGHRAGLEVAVSELHGMSQRGGAVEASVVFGTALPLAPGKEPIDVLLAFELLEALRRIERIDRSTTVVLNRLLIPPQQAVGAGAAIPQAAEIEAAFARRAGAVHLVEATARASAAASPRAANAVMLGAFAALPVCPVAADALAAVIASETSGAAAAANAALFEVGRAEVLRGAGSERAR